ncbi:hypothetical protein N7504_007937 [Penicillium tannophilum]|nr:hypothetical protein N7504_007937 [Penicillium tannophilum]
MSVFFSGIIHAFKPQISTLKLLFPAPDLRRRSAATIACSGERGTEDCHGGIVDKDVDDRQSSQI